MPIDPLLAWLATSIISPDAFTRTVNSIRNKKSEYRDLTKSIKDATGIKPGSSYKKWFTADGVWDDLVANSGSSYIKLRDLLEEQIRAEFPLPWRKRGREIVRERAETLLDATLISLIENLKPSRAIAVVGSRLSAEVQDVKQLLSTKENLSELLSKLPPDVRPILEELCNADLITGSRLLVLLTGNEEPLSVVRSLANEPPEWLSTLPAQAWQGLAQLTQAHGDSHLASLLFEKVSDLGLERSHNLTRAAIRASAASEPDRAVELLEKARKIAADDPMVKVATAVIDGNPAEILEALQSSLIANPETEQYRAFAILQTDGPDAAIQAYEYLIVKYPDYAGIRIQLLRLLMQRALSPGSPATGDDQIRMRSLAKEARDLRRSWRGDSTEAVIAACQLAIARRDWDDAIIFGCSSPNGEANSLEENDQSVIQLVTEATILKGQHEIAQDLIERISDEFQKIFLTAENFLQQNDDARARESYLQAWHAARDDNDRMNVWHKLALLGALLPEIDLLASRDDEYAALILAQVDVNNQNFESALTRLRTWRNKSPIVIEALANAYVSIEEIDTAISTLEQAATRFDDPNFRAIAAAKLADNSRMEEASIIAAATLNQIGRDTRIRKMLHDIMIAASWDRHAWREMEERSRAAIEDLGDLLKYRWQLTIALHHQHQFEDAWSALQKSPPLEPQIEPETRIWIDLNLKFRSDTKLVAQILDFLDIYDSSSEFCGAVIGATIIWMHSIDLPEDLGNKWRTRVAGFLEHSPEGSSFYSIKLPEDGSPQEFFDIMKRFLEPGSAQFAEFQKKVADGQLPYGMLSAVKRKPYAGALMHRAAGCYPITSTSEQEAINEEEVTVAALSKKVVIDTSTLVIAYYLPSIWQRLVASFAQVVIPVTTRSDISSAFDGFNLPSDGTFDWNPDLDRPIMAETNPEDRENLIQHSRWVLDAANDLDIIDWPALLHYPDHSKIPDNENYLPWLLPIDLAFDKGTFYWSDDAYLRALATSIGVRSFGTYALLCTLVNSGTISLTELNLCSDSLRRAYCVDLPFDALALNRISEQEGWVSPSSAFAFSRSATWKKFDRAFQAWHSLILRVAEDAPEHLGMWLYKATLGSCRNRPLNQVAELASFLFLNALAVGGITPANFARLIPATREAVRDFYQGDILPSVVAFLLDSFESKFDKSDAARAVLALSDDLPEQDRNTVRRIVFGAKN